MHREHQHAQLRPALGELARGLQPGHPRHRDVEDREVDVVAQRALDRLGAVAGLGDDLEVGLGVEDEPQPVAHDGVVVGEQDAGGQRYRWSSRDRHVQPTSVPPAPRASMLSLAPMSSGALAHARGSRLRPLRASSSRGRRR